MSAERRDSTLLALVPAVMALVGTVTGSYLTYHFSLRGQIEISNTQRRQQVFGELMGQKFLRTQLYVSRFEALIYSDYHEAKWKRAGYPKESLDLQEAQRWMHKSEDLALEIAKSNQAVFQTVGLIRALFPGSPKLDELVGRVYHFKAPQILVRWDQLNAGQLEPTKKRAVTDLQEFVDREYARPIDELLDYLALQIAK